MRRKAKKHSGGIDNKNMILTSLMLFNFGELIHGQKIILNNLKRMAVITLRHTEILYIDKYKQ